MNYFQIEYLLLNEIHNLRSIINSEDQIDNKNKTESEAKKDNKVIENIN